MALIEFTHDEKMERLTSAENDFDQGEGLNEEEMDYFFELLQ